MLIALADLKFRPILISHQIQVKLKNNVVFPFYYIPVLP